MTDEKDMETENGIGAEGEALDGPAEGGVGSDPQDASDQEWDQGVAELREELDTLNERHLRLAAEYDNYRKRNLREREMLADRLQAGLVTALLDVLDDLQRVEEGPADASAESVREGVRLVEKKLVTILQGAGLETVDADGPFNPEFMEALGTVPTDDPDEDGHVADVFQRGYRLGEILLRPARVRVFQHDETA